MLSISPYDIVNITNCLSISHCYQYQYWYQLMKKGHININSISIIKKSSSQCQYQYQYCHFYLSIFPYQCIVHLWCPGNPTPPDCIGKGTPCNLTLANLQYSNFYATSPILCIKKGLFMHKYYLEESGEQKKILMLPLLVVPNNHLFWTICYIDPLWYLRFSLYF